VSIFEDLINRPAWQQSAACRGLDPDLFYPGNRDMVTAAAARKVCAGCPVRSECAAAGLAEYHGIWGGLSVNQRRGERREDGVVGPEPRHFKEARERRQRAEPHAWPDIEHGTVNGYRSERRHGVTPCDACREANNALQRRYLRHR
jgi:WhiB family transcriptional regulator, redox-sensing transcriptional regulator